MTRAQRSRSEVTRGDQLDRLVNQKVARSKAGRWFWRRGAAAIREWLVHDETVLALGSGWNSMVSEEELRGMQERIVVVTTRRVACVAAGRKRSRVDEVARDSITSVSEGTDPIQPGRLRALLTGPPTRRLTVDSHHDPLCIVLSVVEPMEVVDLREALRAPSTASDISFDGPLDLFLPVIERSGAKNWTADGLVGRRLDVDGTGVRIDFNRTLTSRSVRSMSILGPSALPIGGIAKVIREDALFRFFLPWHTMSAVVADDQSRCVRFVGRDAYGDRDADLVARSPDHGELVECLSSWVTVVHRAIDGWNARGPNS